MAIKSYSAFREPSPYEQESRRAEQQRRLAEMLQQQSMAEEDPYTFQGIRAMPSPAAALGKLLKAYGSKKAAEKAEEAEQRAREADIEGAERLRRELAPETRIAAPTGAEIAGTMGMPQINEEGQLSYGPSVQAPLRTEMVGPTAKERQNIFANYAVSGTPTAQRLAQVLASQEPQTQMMEFGDQLLSVTDGQATPVMMGGKPVTATKTSDSLIGKPSPGDFTPASLAQFARTGNYADLVATPKQPVIGSLTVGDKTTNKYTDALAEGVAKQDLEAIAAGESAIPQIESSYRVRDLLKQNPITGTGAQARLGLERALATAGFGKGERATITDNLSAELAKTTLANIRTSGLGAGQGFTDKDRQFLEKAAAGQIELTQGNLEYLAELNERAARATITRSNAVRGRARQLPQFKGLPNMFPDIAAPPAYGSQLPSGAVLDPPPR